MYTIEALTWPGYPFRIEALVVADMQNWVVENFGVGPRILGRMADVIAAARSRGAPVVYVRVGFRPGHPEIHPGNPTWAPLARAGLFVDGDPAADIHPALAPEPGDVVVVKKRVSAFVGNDLELILRSGGITELVLMGVVTSGVILSTVLQAGDLDFGVTVLSDCCQDRDDETHRMLMERVLPHRARVLDSTAWLASSGAAAVTQYTDRTQPRGGAQ